MWMGRQPDVPPGPPDARGPIVAPTQALRVGVVFNPNSKKNLAQPQRFVALQRLLGDLGEVRRTASVEQIEEVAADFVDRGCTVWVADGGDGAFHWLLHAARRVLAQRRPGSELPLMMPTRSGTVDFLAVKAGLRGGAEDLVARLVRDLRRDQPLDVVSVDTLHVLGRGDRGADWTFDRVGFAAALAGVGQGFFERFYRQPQRSALGIVRTVGRILGSAATRSAPLAWLPLDPATRAYSEPMFAPQPIDVAIDGEPVPFSHVRAVNIGAIDIELAGVFRLFPHAAAPGVMHALVGDPSAWDVAQELPRMALGRPLASARMVDRPATRLTARCRGDAVMDPVIDGEIFYGLTEIDVRLGPQVRIVRPSAATAPSGP